MAPPSPAPAAPSAAPSAAVSSPCVGVCVLDPGTGRCEGCGRTLAQIAAWGAMPEAERRRIMADLAAGPDARGSGAPGSGPAPDPAPDPAGA